MARQARYTQTLPVCATPEVRARLDTIADENNVSLAEVVRDIIDVGLNDAEERWRSQP